MRDRYTITVAFGAALLLLGDALLYLGLSGDVAGWTSKSAFGSNVLAGLTTACFGVPVALFLLSVLYSWQEDLREERKTSRLRYRAVADLLTAEDGSTWCSREVEGVRQCAPLLRKVVIGHRELFTRLESANSRVPKSDEELRRPEELRKYQEWLTESIKNIGEVERILTTTLGQAENVDSEWAARRSRWRFLDGIVRERVFESQSRWLSADNYRKLQEVFEQEMHPFVLVITDRDQYLPPILTTLTELNQSRRDDPPRATEHGLSMNISRLGVPFSGEESEFDRLLSRLEKIVDAFDQALTDNRTP